MMYTVKPVIVEGCECEECRSGRHLYYIYRCCNLESGGWSSVSLHTYASAQECKDNHYWGILFNPEDTWEDGSPIVDPHEGLRGDGQSKPGPTVPLNTEVLKKSATMLEKHWLPPDSTK